MVDPATGVAARAAAADAGALRSAQDFTAVALTELLAPVFATVPTDGPFDGGLGEQTFRPLLIEQIARHMAAAGGLGLTETVHRQILRLQEQPR